MGLPTTETINPDDKTLDALNTELQKPQKGYYVWHTVHDDHVRADHAARDGTIRPWDDSPDPGEDFNCRCWAEKIDIEEIPIINKELDRRKSIIDNTRAIFKITEDKTIGSKAPWYENTIVAKEALNTHSETIEKTAKKHNFDANLVKAVMWAENSRGGQWGFGYILDIAGASSTIMPMNINPNLWGELLSRNKNSLEKPENNIEAATILLKRIKGRIINPTPEKIAAIWQYGGSEITNNYAAYIGRIYKEKPWITASIKK